MILETDGDTPRILTTDPAPVGTAAGGASIAPGDKLLIDMAELAQLTSLSVRHLRRLDSSRDIPGRVAVGRRVLFQTEIIRDWVRAGLPDRDEWALLQRRNGKR
jgi:predicted DNA-binding transcriptional regulator AlpA